MKYINLAQAKVGSALVLIPSPAISIMSKPYQLKGRHHKGKPSHIWNSPNRWERSQGPPVPDSFHLGKSVNPDKEGGGD